VYAAPMARTLWLLCVLLPLDALAAPPHPGLDWQMPTGTWTVPWHDGPVLEARIEPRYHLSITLAWSGSERVRLEGTYRVMANKFADYHVVLTPRRLSACTPATGTVPERCHVVRRADAGALRLDNRTVQVVTLHFECIEPSEGVQVCVHQGDGDKAVVLCGEVADPTRHCKAPPPVDGSQINRPPEAPNRDLP